MKEKSSFRGNRMVAVVAAASLMFCSVSDIGFNKIHIDDFVTQMTAEAYSTGNYKVKTKGRNLNVRREPGTAHSAIDSLPNGSSFTVYEVSGNWGKISSSSQRWVCLEYSTYVGSTNAITPAPSGQTGVGVVNCSALNVRTTPTTEGNNIKTTIRCGSYVNITSTSGNWGYDSNNGGYVYLSYIKFTGGSSNNGGSTGGGSSNYSTVDTSRNYQLEPKCAGNKVVDVTGWGTSNNTNIQIWERGKTQANQTLQPISAGNGYYVLKDVNSGKVLDVCGGNAYDGANVILYDYHGGANQLWRFIYKGKEDGHNWYELESKINGNYCLDVNGAYNANGTNIQLWSRNGSNAQKFMMWYGNVGSGGSNIIDTFKEIINNNSTKGHSEFKPMQQNGESYSSYHWCKKCSTTIGKSNDSSGSGCGIMATINAVGYLTGKRIDPISAASKCSDLHSCGIGGSYDIPERIISNFGSSYGVMITENWSNFKSTQSRTVNTTIGRQTPSDFPTASAFETEWAKLITHLKKGDVAVTLVPHHYIAIVAYDSSTGKVLVYDSAASTARGTSRNEGTWVSKDQLNINSSVSSPGTYQTELKLRKGFIYIGRK